MAFKLSGLASGMDTESIVTELMKAQRLKTTRIQNKITTSEWKQEKWKALNTKLYSFYTGSLSKLRMQGSFNSKVVSSSDEAKATVTAGVNAPEGTHSLKINKLASAQFETGNKLNLDDNANVISDATKLVDLNMVAGADNKINIDAGKAIVSLTITDTTTVGDFTKALKDAGLNATYDTTQKRFFISSKESGYENAFSIETAGTVNLAGLGLSAITKTTDTNNIVTVSGGVQVVPPSDANVIYNGAALTSKTNTISANGLTITLKGVTSTADPTDDESISLNISDNTKAVFDMVKGFVKTYNELIKEMKENYDAPSAKGFDPLTDEEKESMTDDQIEKWEDKIKSSLLRRDNTVDSLFSNMRTTLSESVTVNGMKYDLSSFGIGSANYTEKGILHIDGDEDDSLVSGSTNKLMNALTEDPDTVMKVFNELAGKLFTSMTEKMSSSSLSSALTFYNDKEITKTVTKYKTDLKELEKRLENVENRYYKQFAAMETAMAKMNSESSSLMSMLGGNQQ
ncbi:MAG: flagellar filament capping protein FliD [Mobilitalea sp.]